MKRINNIILILICLALSPMEAFGASFTERPENNNGKAYIAIVIDDLGNSGDGTEEMLALSIPITVAIMPNMPNTQTEAERFRSVGKSIILHMPMEPENGRKSWMGPGGITDGLTAEEIRKRVTDGLDQLKCADGINNHMGSKITKNETIMTEVMTVIKDRDLIILDSKTTNKSKIKDLSEKMGVKYIARDVFLDGAGGESVQTVEQRLRKTAEIAKKCGYAVAIGHVGQAGGTSTAKAIANLATELENDGIEFVTLKDLYNTLHSE